MGIGSAMISRGEVALIVASMGLASNLVTQDLYATIIVVVIVTTIVTPPMMKFFFQSNMKTEAKIS
jgi:Kef-type K+ transport system membrane component KefB